MESRAHSAGAIWKSLAKAPRFVPRFRGLSIVPTFASRATRSE